MDHDFWHSRWQENIIGFHQEQINPYLVEYWPNLHAPKGTTVFVPLCGKSRDMGWLHAQGYKVVGVELSPLAVEAFFKEEGIAAQQTTQGPFQVAQGEGIRLFTGDFFAMDAQTLKDVSAVYDRASMVALPPQMRRDYAAHMKAICPAKVNIMLVAIEFTPVDVEGPPFTVTEQEVRKLYEPEFSVQCVMRADMTDKVPRMKERGISALYETVYLLKREG